MRRTTISHFSFLISHSSEAFARNQGTARPKGWPSINKKRELDRLGKSKWVESWELRKGVWAIQLSVYRIPNGRDRWCQCGKFLWKIFKIIACEIILFMYHQCFPKYSDSLTPGFSEKCWKGHTIHIVPQYPSSYKIVCPLFYIKRYGASWFYAPYLHS